MKKFNIRVNGKSYEVEVEELGTGLASTTAQSLKTSVSPSVQKAPPSPSISSESAPSPAPDQAPGATGGKITAPMPGVVIKINVGVGN